MIDFSQLVASIELQRQGNIVIIRPHIENPVPITFQYRLEITQHGPGGASNIHQQGNIRPDSTPASVRLVVSPEASCYSHLQVLYQDEIVKDISQLCEGGGANQ